MLGKAADALALFGSQARSEAITKRKANLARDVERQVFMV
jgi:hypothetical protein